uniref:Carnosine dipeptidase 1 n=1 Tax=Amazona collaria TaxID=241587 RepID=A0A8B9ISY0_9PSIT
MEEARSLGLGKLLQEENQCFFSDVDYVVTLDSLWLSNKKPAFTYESEGNACFFVDVECGSKYLHNGTSGGISHEPLMDLIALLGNNMHHCSGVTGEQRLAISLTKISAIVASLTEEESKLYEPIQFNLEEHKSNSGRNTPAPVALPSLSIHGFEGAFNEPGIKTVIPAKVIGKFSIRQVPHMDLSVVEQQVKAPHDSPNKLKVSMPLGAKPWLADVNDPLYKAARRAIKTVFGEDPDFIWDGSTVPVARMFQTTMQKSVIMFSIGAADDGECFQNEKISTLLSAAFFLEIYKLHRHLHEKSNTETNN